MMTFEEEIQNSGKLIYTTVGVSMRPLIKQGRDLLIVTKPQGRLKKYDIPLYKRKNGQYVLHRVVKVKDDGYVILGDNCIKWEMYAKGKKLILTASVTGFIQEHGICSTLSVLYL